MRPITRLWFLVLSLILLALARRQPLPPTPAAAPTVPATLIFTGDILLANRAGLLAAAEGPGALLAEVREPLRQASVAVGNLECALATQGRPASKDFTFRAHPSTARALSEAGYDVLTLANNHSVDYGPAALLETMATLQQQGLLAVGAGRDRQEARRFLVVERGSPPVRIALLAFSNMLPASFYAGADRPGTNPALASSIREDVSAARSRADVVIVLMHWGQELSPAPSASQRQLADLAVEAGADLVVGHHPHVLQGLEQRGHALVAYSLGNFVFPSRGESSRTMMLHYTVGRDGAGRAEVIPCVIEGFSPRPATGEEREAVLARLIGLSRGMDTELTTEGVIALPPRPVSVDKARAPALESR